MKQELFEHLVRYCVREVLAQVNENEDPICSTCNGSGEGQHDGSKCSTCGGSGRKNSKKKLTKRTDPDYDHDLDTPLKEDEEKYEECDCGAQDCSEHRPHSDECSVYKKKVSEGDPDIKGAAAPPADGQGTGDQPEIPNEEPEIPDAPSEPETPPPSADLKGLVIVNPKDKAKLEKVNIQGKDDASIERELHKAGSLRAGSRVKVAISTIRAVKDALRNPNTATYLYLGKYDPNSDEIFLMADKSLQVAKDASVPASELTGTPVMSPSSEFNPMSAGADEFAGRMQNQGQTPVHGLDEQLKKIVKKMVNECLDRK